MPVPENNAAPREAPAGSLRQVVITPDHEDGGFVAEVPSLPGCISQGETVEEALANIRDAMTVWLSGAAEAGLGVPTETFGTRVFAVEACVHDTAGRTPVSAAA